MEKDDKPNFLQVMAFVTVIAFFTYNKVHDHIDPPDWAIFLFITFAFIGKKVSNVILKVLERLVGK